MIETTDDAQRKYQRRQLRELVAKTDGQYADDAAAFFQIDRALVLKARRLGRASALEHLAYGVPFSGEVDARNYRIVSCREDADTNIILEQCFLIAYTSEYYSNLEEIVTDVR